MRPIDAEAARAKLQAARDKAPDGSAEKAAMDTFLYFLDACPTIEAEPMRQWVSVKDRLPESQMPVLAVVRSKSFPKYVAITVAEHINAHEVTTEDWRDYEGDTENDEEKDCFWIRECWYELNAVDDNPNLEINCGDYITHWMPLPKAPKEETKK